MKKQLPVLLLMLCFSVFLKAQDADHPRSALIIFEEKFSQASLRQDYPQMISLMDSMISMERSIDRNAGPQVFEKYRGYSGRFSGTLEGRTVYSLFMARLPERYPRFIKYPSDTTAFRLYKQAVLDNEEDLLRLPAGPWQNVLHASEDIYPCRNLMELSLFLLGEYQHLLQILNKGAGNVPANAIVAHMKQLEQNPLSEEETLRRLDSLITRYAGEEPVARVYLAKARRLLSERDPDFPAIYSLCESVIRQFPGSALKAEFTSIMKSLTRPRLNLTIKNQVYPGSPAQVYVTRSNIVSFTLKIHNTAGKTVYKKNLKGLTASMNRPVTDTLTIPTPAEGSYSISVQSGKTTVQSKFYSGKVAAMFSGRRGAGYVYATDLQSGKPLREVEVVFPGKSTQPVYLMPDGFTGIPSQDSLKAWTEKDRLLLRLQIPATKISPVDSFSVPLSVNRWDLREDTDSNHPQTTAVQIFTDRSLYQPGDTLFFKGIAMRYQNGKQEVIPGERYRVELVSAQNRQDTVASVTLQTNEFGSFSGYFTTSANMMNGAYFISVPGSLKQVWIESYTRPSFSIEMQPVAGTYSFGDTVRQEGSVNNYAGFPLAGARIVCEVTRQPVYGILPEYYRRTYFPSVPIASDTLYADTEGRFVLTFPALRPNTDGNVFCSYYIIATVTDRTGETQRSENSIPVGDIPYTIHISFKDNESWDRILLVKDTCPELKIAVRNLNGTDLNMPGTYNLIQDGKTVFSGSFCQQETSQPDWASLPSGSYQVSVPAPWKEAPRATPVTQSFTLFGLADTASPVETPLFFYPSDGEFPVFYIGTREKELYVLAELFKEDSLIVHKHLTVSNELRKFDFPGFALSSGPYDLLLTAVCKGDCYTERTVFEARRESSILNLQVVSFRDTAAPDSVVTFGLRTDPAQQAEILLSVYNAGTDRFFRNDFTLNVPEPVRKYPPYFREQFSRYAYQYDEPRKNAGMVMYKTAEDSALAAGEQTAVPANEPVSLIRTDFSETLAFLPHLVTDSTGYVPVSFRTNGLLSTFRLLFLAHNRSAVAGYAQKELVVKKEVMIMPSFPKFLREGDRINWKATAVNLTDESLEGNAFLKLNGHSLGTHKAVLPALGRQMFSWEPVPLENPADSVMLLTVLAGFTSAAHNDAEQHRIPVLSRKEQITRAQTRVLPGNGIVTLVKTNRKASAELEVSTPITSALNALPALCTPARNNLTDWLSAYYANNTGAWLLERYPSLAASVKDIPAGQAAPLLKNQAITQILLEETPWSRYAVQEAKRIERLQKFSDPQYIKQFNKQALDKFNNLQRADGGFSWFPGMESSYTLTCFFLEKISGMVHAGVIADDMETLRPLVERALAYVDNIFATRYEIKGFDVMLYFYIRSAFPEVLLSPAARDAAGFFLPKIEEAWKGTSVMEKIYFALTYRNMGKTEALNDVLSSLEEYAVRNSTTGCYFPNAVPFNGLMSSEMKAHAMLLNLFKDNPALRTGLQQWILLQKKNHAWGTGESTTGVIDALLQTGVAGPEPGKGYEIVQKGNTYTVRNRSDALLFVSLYEQTIEDIGGTDSFSNGLDITRAFYRVADGKPLAEGDPLETGTEIGVRYFISNNEDLSFVHLKASRAACLTPVTETSGYEWNRTCGYYREIKESATQFFFQSLPKGDHIIEEQFFVTQSGVFNSGFARVQSLYAPENRGHSSGGVLIITK